MATKTQNSLMFSVVAISHYTVFSTSQKGWSVWHDMLVTILQHNTSIVQSLFTLQMPKMYNDLTAVIINNYFISIAESPQGAPTLSKHETFSHNVLKLHSFVYTHD